jgi:short subunit dehydrogenase-like uncharacterized protein
MPGRIVVFGATGYTGRLVAERLAAAGAAPVLAGRNEERLKRLAASMDGDVQTVKADVMRQNSVFEMVGPDDVLVTTVGPFNKWGDPAVRAAIAAPCPYMDSTGESTFIRRIFEEFSGPAEAAGVPLMTAMGYDFVPGSLAGALALEEAGEDAVRVDVGYYSLGAGLDMGSAGTKESLVGVTLDPGYKFEGGRLVSDRPAARVRSFEVKGRDRPAVSVPAAEHFALPASYPRLQEVNVYLGWFGPLARAMQAGSLATSMVTRLPGARTVLQKAGERLVSLTGSPEPGTTPGGLSWIAATAYSSAGDPLAEVHLSGADGYDFTASFLAWAARRTLATGVDGAGALGPVRAFGLETLEAGCAEAGLTRVREPAAP